MAANEEGAAISHGNVYDHFSEYNEVCSIIDTLPQLLSDFRALEASQERFTCKLVSRFRHMLLHVN